MNLKESQLEIKKSMRVMKYYTNSNKVLLVLHGYGQLIQYFTPKFKEISSHWNIVAPEGMHRFYLNGTSGRVGASWMTREWRLQDILENNLALDLLSETILKELPNVEFHVLGFSQGGATAARWVQFTKIPLKSLTLWASVFPPDLEVSTREPLFPEVEKKFVIGTKDPYYSEENLRKIIEDYSALGFEITTFDGEHVIHEKTLRNLFL